MILLTTLLLACSTPEDPAGRADVPPAEDPVATVDPSDPADPVTEDRVAVILPEGTDLCAYDDLEVIEAQVQPTPDGYVVDVRESPYQPCLDGRLWVSRRIIDHPDGRLDLGDATATFFSLTEIQQEWQSGEWLDPAEGLDDCGLVTLGMEGLYSEGDLAWLDPGAVDLTGSAGTLPFDRAQGGSVLNFNLPEADAAAITPGGVYGLSVAGLSGTSDFGPFAAIELPDLVTVPERLELLAPANLGPGVAIPRADLALEWTGTSDGEITITFDGGGYAPWYRIECIATDDGAFTVPGALISAFPADGEAFLTVSRRVDTWVGTEAGRSLQGTGVSSHEAWMLTVP